MKKRLAECVTVLFLLGFPLDGPAMAAGTPGITITDGWMRALPAGLPAGGYFTLRNMTGRPVSLGAARSPGCGSLMLHQSMGMGGMEQMRTVSRVVVPAGGEVKFAPGGYHLMCMNPTLKIGTSIPVTFEFSGGIAVTANFAVRDARGK